MCLHGGEDFRAVGHDAEHVGYVAALRENLIEQGCQIGCDFTAIEPGYAGHGAS